MKSTVKHRLSQVTRAVTYAQKWTGCYWPVHFGSASAAAVPGYLLSLTEVESDADRVIDVFVEAKAEASVADESYSDTCANWRAAFWYALRVNARAKDASAYGVYAIEMAKQGAWEEGLRAVQIAEAIETSMSGRPKYWMVAVGGFCAALSER